jgi:flagellar protein FliS
MQYKEQAIYTMSKGELVIALFDEELKNMKYAKLLMEQGDYDAGKKCTEKCKKIFNYLCASLNRHYPVSQNLYQLYTFINHEIIKAETTRETAALDTVIPIVTELRDVWIQAEKLIHMQSRQ